MGQPHRVNQRATCKAARLLAQSNDESSGEINLFPSLDLRRSSSSDYWLVSTVSTPKHTPDVCAQHSVSV
jgi:hypothetical protein